MASELRWVDVAIPEPRKGEVQIRVVNAGLNRDDVHSAEGTVFGGLPTAPRPSLKRPRIPGLEFAGTIEAVGPGVQRHQVGDRVFGVVYGTSRIGAMAPFCCTKASRVHRLPDHWSFEQGAAMAFSGVVAALAIRTAGDPDGKRCLVVGASGNIGGLIVQALVAAGAKEVVGVCSGATAKHVESLGADHVVDYTQASWGDQLPADRAAFDVVYDCVGGRDTEVEALAVLEPDGHLLTLCGPIRHLGGERLSAADITKAIAYIARRMATSRVRGPHYTFLSGTNPDWVAVQRWLLNPGVVPTIGKVFPYEREAVADAIGELTTNHTGGKLLVTVNQEEPAEHS
ncbi:MAG: NAD(P)-dependent alcohol dehydrogenase [Actinomycetia bacterium]|nr:NAD(P)-dependent alcohol dehydrogenase [Actinomycetes bacterium]